MSEYAAYFKNHMDQKGIRYTEREDGVISVRYDGKNIQTVDVLVFFDANNAPRAQFVTFSIGKFPKEQFAKALVVCNEANNHYRWFRFYIDDNDHVCAGTDAILQGDTCGEECMELVLRMVNVVDEMYPQFMKARWA